MKNTLSTYLWVVFLATSFTLTAQPKMTLWSVDEAHLEDHSQGFAEEWLCGYEYYITYNGEYSSTVFILDIANEGDQDLILTEIPAFTAGSSSNFAVISPPSNLTIPPNSSVHFGVLYDAPAEYISAMATLEIKSNDPDHGTCTVNFQVGFAAPTVQLREGSTIIPRGGNDIDFGQVVVGQSATKTLNIYNAGLFEVIIVPCKLLIDWIPEELFPPLYPREPIRLPNIDFMSGPLQIPGPNLPFPLPSQIIDPPFPGGPIPIPFPGTFLGGPNAAEYMTTDLPFPSFSLTRGNSQTFDLTFSPTELGDRPAAICYHYIEDGKMRGGDTSYGITGEGTSAIIADLPNLPKYGLFLLALMVIGIGGYLVTKRI